METSIEDIVANWPVLDEERVAKFEQDKNDADKRERIWLRTLNKDDLNAHRLAREKNQKNVPEKKNFYDMSRDIRNSPGERLWYSTAIDDVKMVEFLCDLYKGKNHVLNWQGENGNTPLHIASQGLNLEIVNILLKTIGVKINMQNFNNRTPLEAMIDIYGSEDYVPDENNVTPNDVVQALSEKGANKFRPVQPPPNESGKYNGFDKRWKRIYMAMGKGKGGDKRKTKKSNKKSTKRRKSGKRRN